MAVRSLGLAIVLVCLGCGGGGGLDSGEQGTREIRFQSAPSDEVPITLDTQDLQGRTDGVTNFVRVYPRETVVRVAAPSTYQGLPFYKWVWDGGSADAPVLSVPADQVTGLTAVFGDGCTFSPNYADDLERLLYWQRMPVRVFLVLDANATQSAVEAARTGFEWWNDRLGGIVRWTEVSSASNADVVVRWSENLEGNLLGYTQYTYEVSSGRMLSAEIVIRAGLDGRAGEGIAAHEMGHALGIGGHSPLHADLMYSTYTGFNMNEVTLRDANTVRTGHCHLFGGNRSTGSPSGTTATSRIVCPSH
jgi:hypothetical protein